jgi:hypothetical protein
MICIQSIKSMRSTRVEGQCWTVNEPKNEPSQPIIMASLSSSVEGQQEAYDVSSNRIADTRWSDIDKYRLYSFGELVDIMM